MKNYYPDFDDERGVGLVLINSVIGAVAYGIVEGQNIEATYEQGLKGNPCLEHSVIQTNDRIVFWKNFSTRGMGLVGHLYKKQTPSILKRILKKITRIFKLCKL